MSRLLLALLISLSSLHAQETLFRVVADTKTDTHIEATALFSNPSLGGYHPVRITISNNQKIPHKVFLNFNNISAYSQGISASSSFSFEAPPGDVVVRDILVPLTVQNGDHNAPSFSVQLSGSMGKAQGSASPIFTPIYACVLLSEAL